jgi:methyl-accepting chemotaxis protein
MTLYYLKFRELLNILLNRNSLATKLFISVLFIGIIYAIIFWKISVNRSAKIIQQSTENELILAAKLSSSGLSSELDLAIETARGLMRLSQEYAEFPEQIRRDVIKNSIRASLEQNPNFLCSWGVFELNSIDNFDSRYTNLPGSTDKGRFCPSYYRNNKNEVVEEDLVYNDDELVVEDYYLLPKERQQETILEPYFYSYEENSSDSVFETTVALPVYSGSRFIGVVGVDFKLEKYNSIIDQIKPLETGYAFLMSSEGTIVSHPVRENIGKPVNNISEFENREEILKKLTENKSFTLPLRINGNNPATAFVTPLNVGKTGSTWWLVSIAEESQIIKPVNKLRTSLMIAGIFSILALAVVMAIITYRIGYSISSVKNEISKATQNILEGKLNITMQKKGIDSEFLPILNDLDHITDSISGIVSEVRNTAANINEMAFNLNETFEKLSGKLKEQASSTDSISSSIEEITASIEQNSENTDNTKSIAMQVVKSIEQVNNSSKLAMDLVKQISEKIQVVDEIAFQTNLLALNAAVEAARAGDVGRGFSVVAAEVKKLAEKSKTSANEIVHLVNRSVNQNKEAGKLLNEIIPEIDKTAHLVQEITASNKEQRSSSELINHSVQFLSSTTHENSSLIEEIGVNASVLASHSDILLKRVQEYQIEE